MMDGNNIIKRVDKYAQGSSEWKMKVQILI